MSHAKQASTKRKRSINAVPVLSAAGRLGRRPAAL
jgi:hypothetical protein